MPSKPISKRFWQLARVSLCAGALWLALANKPLRAAGEDSTILQTCDATELIAAVVGANADTEADAIVLAPGCNGVTAYLLMQANNSGNGLPVITSNITIEGNGSTIARSTANGVPQFRLFQVNPLAILTLNDVTLQGGNAGNDDGGGVYTTGTLYVNGSVLSGNTAGRGGGVYLQYPGTLYMTTTTITQNSATQWGGGITVGGGGTATITRSTFLQNSLVGGGIFGGGFAMFNSSATIVNSTFYNNNAGAGNGAAVGNEAGDLNLVNDTISGNVATGTSGGGINNQGNTLIQNTIFSLNSGNNCSTINDMDQGNNIDSGATCGFTASTSLNNTNPQLGPLASNGGPTQTMAIPSNSAAVGAASRVGCNIQPVAAIDQRGIARQGLHCDIGAYEFENGTLGCDPIPGAPKLISPDANAIIRRTRISFDWKYDSCARKYKIKIVSAQDPAQVIVQAKLKPSHFTTTALTRGNSYLWQVQACAKHQCGEASPLRPFSIEP